MIKKTILVCPLDWGLGHATRCVPLINQFLNEGHQVIIGADKNPLAFLQKEFPRLKTIIIPGYEITYSQKGNALKLFYESVKFFSFIKEEHKLVDKLIEDNNIDMIVSDNRYGLYSKKVKSIIITHQLFVKTPIGEKIAHKKIASLLIKFDKIWIPDYEGKNNLSGDLSHLKPIKQPHKFIGSLSRFTDLYPSPLLKKQPNEYDIIAILSGPEPQRTIFEKLIFEQIEEHNLRAVVVRGLPSKNENTLLSKKPSSQNNGNIKIFNHLGTDELFHYIQKSVIVVCRAGYSSIMDLAVLNQKAILVPTPGQTEQEYLAQYHSGKNNFDCQKQSEFDLSGRKIETMKF